MTTDLETLRQLQDAVEPLRVAERTHPLYEQEADFYNSAHAALGPDGCVTKELERLRDLADMNEYSAEYHDLKEDCTALKSGLEKERYEKQAWAQSAQTLLAERDSLQRAVKDAQKENAILLARLAKVSAAAEAYVDEDTFEKLKALHVVLDELALTQAKPSASFKSTSTLSPCPRCGETVPTTFRAGVLTYQCLKCAEDA